VDGNCEEQGPLTRRFASTSPPEGEVVAPGLSL